MQTKKHVKIDYLSLPQRDMQIIMEVADRLGVPPKKVCELMVSEGVIKAPKTIEKKTA